MHYPNILIHPHYLLDPGQRELRSFPMLLHNQCIEKMGRFKEPESTQEMTWHMFASMSQYINNQLQEPSTLLLDKG